MKDIKYLNHIVRNIYLFTIFLISVSLIHQTIPTWFAIMLGFLAYFISYIPIYFLNDYVDHKEDKKYGRDNLYLAFKNKRLFWVLGVSLALAGTCLAAYLNGLLLLIILYLLNTVYSVNPMRTRDRIVLRELTIFVIYIVKVFYVATLLHFPLSILPMSIVVMAASAAAAAVSVYKRYLKAAKISELIFGVIFMMSWALTILLYKPIFWIFVPLAPAVIFLALKYKKEQVPIGIYQLGYFIYAIIIYWIIS